jgi:hypothetical protein
MFVKHLYPLGHTLKGDESVCQISFQYVQTAQRKWTKTANYWNFSKSKGHNSVKNGSTVPKTKLDLDILMIKSVYQISLQSVQRKWTETADGLTNWLTDRQKAAKQSAFLSKKGGHKMKENFIHFIHVLQIRYVWTVYEFCKVLSCL